MKKYFSFIMMAMLMALPLVFAGCSSDDDDDENGGEGGSGKIESVANLSGSQMVGTWRCISNYVKSTANGKVILEETDTEIGSTLVISQTEENAGTMFSTSVKDGYEETVDWKIESGMFWTKSDGDWTPKYVTELSGTRMTMVTDIRFEDDGIYTAYSKVVLERVR